MPSKEKTQTNSSASDRMMVELSDFISAEVARRMEAFRVEMKAALRARPRIDRRRREKPAKAARPAPAPPPPKAAPRSLNMECRVEGCGNRSRGPRAGYICDLHRAKLTPAEQLAARERYKAGRSAPPPAAAAPSVSALAPREPEAPPAQPPPELLPPPQPPQLEMLSPPQPKEMSPPPEPESLPPAPAPEEVPPALAPGVAPHGCDYLLTIERVRLVDLRKLGPTLELKFTVAEGPHLGSVARGQFPVAGRGLPVLIEAALGEKLDLSDPETLGRLAEKKVLADVVHTGNPDGSLAIVRNIRPAPNR